MDGAKQADKWVDGQSLLPTTLSVVCLLVLLFPPPKESSWKGGYKIALDKGRLKGIYLYLYKVDIADEPKGEPPALKGQSISSNSFH